MIDESVRRNWCQEFDQILDQLAQEAPHFVNIQKREHQYCVSGTIQVTLVVPFSVGALAATEDDASDQVIDDPDCILDNLDLGGCARYVESTSVEVDNVIQD
jgi:hypothetical protein